MHEQLADGLYYRHDCPTCAQITYDCLPMLVCPRCHSDLVAVAFDSNKRRHELAEHQQELFTKGHPQE